MIDRRIREKVCAEIDRLRDEITSDLQELVRIPSVVGSEGEAQTYMERLYGSADLQPIRHLPVLEEIEAHPAFIRTEMSYWDRPNIIGIQAGDPAAPSIILNGHIDVVSPEPVEAWTHGPWSADIEGDRLYGRGSGDMKAGLIANFYAIKAIRNAGFAPRGTVMLQSVIDEEAGGAGGTLSCLHAGYTAAGMICTEPHNLNITIAHAGINYFRVKVLGKTSHAGLAHLGVNAIGLMYPIYHALTELDEKRAVEVRFPLFEKGSGRSCHINIGTFHSGDWPSSVAGKAELECRIGYIPGEKMGDIKTMIEDAIHRVAESDPWLREHPPKVEWFGWQTEPWHQDPQHPFVQCFKASAEEILMREADYIGRACGIDSRFAPYFGMPSACTGPVAKNIHGIDEYVEISSVVDVTKILAATILNWCGCID